MTRYMVALVIPLLLSGCATTLYRNYMPDAHPSAQSDMAEDTLNRLATIYSPARTQFDIEQSAQDPYGHALIHGLRGAGYAVKECSPDASVAKSVNPSVKTLNYVVDRINAVYTRISIRIGDRILTRGYHFDGHHYSPAGDWTGEDKA
jgi:uncharacterized protein YceK